MCRHCSKIPQMVKDCHIMCYLCYLSIHRHYFILTCERYYGWRGCLGAFKDTLLYPHMWAVLWVAGWVGTFTDTLLYPHMWAVLWVAGLPGDIHRHTTISSHVSGTMDGGVAWGHSQTYYYILTCERYYGWRACLGTFTDTLLYPHMWAVLWVAGLPGDIHRHTTISSHVSGSIGGGVAWGHSQTHYYILTCERYYGWRGCLGTFTDTLLYPHMWAVLWVAGWVGTFTDTLLYPHMWAVLCVARLPGDIHRPTTISSHVSGTMGGGVGGDIHRCTTISSHVSGTMDGGLPGDIHRHTTISSHVSGTMCGAVAWGHSQTHYYILTCERYYGWRGCLGTFTPHYYILTCERYYGWWGCLGTRYLKLLVIACNILCNRYMVYYSSEQVDSTMTPNLCITKYILLMRVYAIHVVQFIY